MRGIEKLRIVIGLAALICVTTACGGGSSKRPTAVIAPIIELQPSGATWSATPVEDSIDDLSNNGHGYTGEIDRYAIDVPEDGRLQIVLEWSQASDLDLIVTRDAEGLVRLAEGLAQGFDPEMVKVSATAGERIWIFVAGWEGEGSEYTLETLLLPTALPPFELNALPNGDTPLARNHPLTLSFTEDLDASQRFPELVHFFGAARAAQGQWCPIGRILMFLPRLPESPDDNNVLLENTEYILQFPRASRGLRSIHGEYLDSVIGGAYSFSGWGDANGENPLRVLTVTPSPTATWDGVAVELEISGALDPATIAGVFEIGGIPLPTTIRLLQQFNCGEELRSRLEFRPSQPISAGSTVELAVPGTILRLGGTSPSIDGITGPAPAAPGDGIRLSFVVAIPEE